MLVKRWGIPLLCGIAIGAYTYTGQRANEVPRAKVAPELAVTLPLAAQVLFSMGDRYLAANLAGFRVLVASTDRMGPDDYKVQARLQSDLSLLNPAHEDNYYIAAAILTWSGQVSAAQQVLRRAADARTFDWQPLFFYAFNKYHFFKDPAGGAAALIEAVPRAGFEQQDQWALQNLAAVWIERGYQASAAAGIVQSMANNAPPGAFQKYLGLRARRLQQLVTLKALAADYRSRFGRPIASLEDLVTAGLLREVPVDPLKLGFGVSATGEPYLINQPGGGQ